MNNKNTEYVTIHVEKLGKKIKAPKGSNLGLILSKTIGFPLPCGGSGFCGKCLVKIIQGKTSPPTSLEKLRGYGTNGYRLACQVKVLGDIVVEVPQIPREYIKVPKICINIPLKRIKPLFKVIELNCSKTPKDVNLRKYFITSKAFREIIKTSGKAHAIEINDIIYLVKESLTKPIVCLIDLGSSKIAIHLIDYRSLTLVHEDIIINPQVRIGMDIMSRLASILHGRESTTSIKEMTIKAIEERLRKLEKEINMKLNDIVAIAIAGNSAITSILLEEPINTLARKPFQPTMSATYLSLSSELGFKEISNALTIVMPLIGGFVGGDAFMDYVATSYLEEEKGSKYMVIDLGVNTEIVLVNEDKVFFTSTPAGPAFEGHITSGVHYPQGAIINVRVRSINGGKIVFEWKTTDNSKPRGLLAAGAISILHELLEHKIMDYSGKLNRYNRIVNGIKAIEIVPETETAHGKPIVITQQDIRELQKAIAAVKTAWRILLQVSNVKVEEIDRVYIAGTFGTTINPIHARSLMIVPPVDVENIIPTGNLVLQGLKISIFDSDYFMKILERINAFMHINLVSYRDFNRMWIENLKFR